MRASGPLRSVEPERAHSDAEVEHLRKFGADFVIMGEREIARGMLEHLAQRVAASGAAAADPGSAAA